MNEIHAINKVIEKYEDYHKPLYKEFIDYEKAFDSVSTAIVMEALRGQRVEEAYMGLLKDIYK